MSLLLVSVCLASDWPTARGPAEGTQQVEGEGAITGLGGGYPNYAWRADYSTTSYLAGYSVVLDADGDGRPETIGATQGRIYLWDEDGSVLAVSDSMATPYIHGLYDLDGDGVTNELVVIGVGVGGGVFIFNASSLALLWRSEDPGLNGGGAFAETAVVDTDGDGIPELLWSTSFIGYADYRLLSFALGFADPVEVTFPLPTTSTGLLPPVEGAYAGAPGGFLVEQGLAVTWVETADRLATGAVCSDDETRCMRQVTQYTGVHAAGTYGDRMSFDADGDGDAEYLSSGSNDVGGVDVGVLDPSRGLTTDEALVWQYRYGVGGSTPLGKAVYSTEGQGILASNGERVVAVSVYGSDTTETDAAGNPADDCVDAPTDYAVVAFDAMDGTPLATMVGPYTRGAADLDGDGLEEIFVDDDTSITGYELVCSGSWNSCSDTGCTLEPAWTLDGTVALALNQNVPADSWHSDPIAEPAVLDLDGDDRPEILMEEGGDLVAWHVDSDGSTTEVGRYSLGTCSTLGGWTGSGTDTWILLEGSGCHVVLDSTLAPLSSPSLQNDIQGVSQTLIGSVGTDRPVVVIGNRVYTDPSSSSGMAAPTQILVDTPVRFADLDGDGVDELVTYTNAGDGDWRVVLYEWSGSSYVERWNVDSTALGATDRSIAVAYAAYSFAVGNFDGTGALDVAVFTIDFTRGSAGFPLRGTLLFLNGSDGSLLQKYLAPQQGLSALYAEPMQAADLCSGTTCPGTDGIDELVFLGAKSVEWYSATSGYLLGWTTDTSTSEAMWGDFDRDGEPELALGAGFTSTTAYNVQVAELDGTVRWEATPVSAAGSPYTMHAAADVDEDGALDVIVGGGYGELTAYAGSDGAIIPGFPFYLHDGEGSAFRSTNMRRVLQVALADVDGDGHQEALVAHDDGYLYAVNLVPADDGPSVAWSMFLGTPVYNVRLLDADGDRELEVLVLPNDGTARLIDGGDTHVVITEPEEGACVSDDPWTLAGTAEGVTDVEIFVQGISQGTFPVTDGAWSASLTWPSEGTFRVEVWAVDGGELIASDTVSVTYFDDADGDGAGECDGDCDDANPDRFPGNDEVCDGVDSDCDGAVSDESDDDGDGYRACEECDDGDATVNPDGVEACNEVDDDCDGEVDEDDVCMSVAYFRGGGGCGCDSGAGAPGVGMIVLAGLVARRRRG